MCPCQETEISGKVSVLVMYDKGHGAWVSVGGSKTLASFPAEATLAVALGAKVELRIGLDRF